MMPINREADLHVLCRETLITWTVKVLFLMSGPFILSSRSSSAYCD